MPENYLFTSLLIRTPLLFFYGYAALVCWKKRKIAVQPASFGVGVYAAAILGFIWSVLIFLRYGLFDTGYMEDIPVSFRLLNIYNILVFLALLSAVFAWRRNDQSTYKEAGILTGMALGGQMLFFILLPFGMRYIHMGYQTAVYFVPIASVVVAVAVQFCLLKALFLGRGYPVEESLKEEEDLPAHGMFNREDYIPYLCGAFILGGFGVIPLVWGAFWDIDYGSALLSSLISCFVFAVAHDKRGNFLFNRFIMANVYVFFVMMRAMAQSRGRVNQPVFIAGGVLGYMVMFGCGWAGIWIVRLVRRQFKGSNN